MKQLLSILALSVGLLVRGPGVLGQCTISNAIVYNLSTVGTNTSFNLKFTHVRNAGNKWITIHLWSQAAYPNYGYGSVPTAATLGGQVPFGTIVINNSVVSSSGTYTAAQAYASSYQNDGSFPMATGSGSSLTYDASTNLYTLTVLNVTLPGSVTVIKGDAWSSQANNNQVVHCFYKEVPIVITPMPATGLESFKMSVKGSKALFTWTAQTEINIDYYKVERQWVGTSEWYTAGIIPSKNKGGNSATPTSYSLEIDTQPVKLGLLWVGLFLVVALLIGRFMQGNLRVLCMLCLVVYAGTVSFSCKKSTVKDEAELFTQGAWYRLTPVDLDGSQDNHSPARLHKS